MFDLMFLQKKKKKCTLINILKYNPVLKLRI